MTPFGRMESESGGPLKGAGVPAMMERGRQGNGGGQGWVGEKKEGRVMLVHAEACTLPRVQSNEPNCWPLLINSRIPHVRPGHLSLPRRKFIETLEGGGKIESISCPHPINDGGLARQLSPPHMAPDGTLFFF